MPKKFYKKRKSSGKSKRSYRKKSKYTKITSMSLKGVSNFPDRLFCKIAYNEDGSYSGTSAYQYIWRGNSAYDPNETGTGHQPYMFDQMLALYDRCYVLGTKITIELYNTHATNPFVFTLAPTTSATITGNMPEHEYNITKVVPPNAGQPTRFKQYMSTSKWFGITKNGIIGDSDYDSSGGNPSKAWKWITTADDTHAGTVTYFARIRLVYYCCFTTPVQWVAS